MGLASLRNWQCLTLEWRWVASRTFEQHRFNRKAANWSVIRGNRALATWLNKNKIFEGVNVGSIILRCLVLLGLLSPAVAFATMPMVSAGSIHSLALKSDGTVVSWGNNSVGQLGDGTNTNRASPVPVTGLNGVVAVAAGGMHTVALKADGTLMSWGYNPNGALGDGSTTTRTSPVLVPNLTNVIKVAAGAEHSLALKSNGTVMAWGSNSYGELGDGSNTSHTSPVVVPGLSGVVDVIAGGYRSFALKSDGTVMAWGYNLYGGLGDGSAISRNNPVALPSLAGVIALAGGFYHSLALKSDGTVMAWGENNNGQLGDGSFVTKINPVEVQGLSNIVTISAGRSHSSALKSDGTVIAWGNNILGQMASPEAVPSLIGAVAISSGSRHTIAIQSDGRAIAWGSNNNGELGDGSTTSSQSSPVYVSDLDVGLFTTLTPSTLSFSTSYGTTSEAQSMTLLNISASPIQISGINVSEGYARTTTCGSTLVAGASCTIDVTFTPTIVGPVNGSLGVSGIDGLLLVVSLTGTGLGQAASLSSGSLSWPPVYVGTGNYMGVILANAATSPLSVTSVTATGDFVPSHSCGSGLGIGESCVVSVTFTPSATGIRTGTMTISTNAYNSPHIVNLSGTGQALPIEFSSSSLSFATTTVNIPSVSRSVTVTNTGGAILGISSISASGDFAATHNCGSGLYSGNSCRINVTFTPSAVGARTGVLLVVSTSPGSPHVVSLNGTGVAAIPPALSLNPTLLTFINQIVGTTSSTQTITLTNTGGATLSISNIARNNSVYGLSHNCSSLASATSCTLNVTYSPTSAASTLSSITITSNAAGSPHTVVLNGNAVPPAAPVCTLTASPTSVPKNGTSVLTSNCTNSPSSLSWTGGSCAGTSGVSCSVSPASTTTYGVTGANAAGSSSASATVTVRSVDLTPILMLLLD